MKPSNDNNLPIFSKNRRFVRWVLEAPLLQKKMNGIYEIKFGG